MLATRCFKQIQTDTPHSAEVPCKKKQNLTRKPRRREWDALPTKQSRAPVTNTRIQSRGQKKKTTLCSKTNHNEPKPVQTHTHTTVHRKALADNKMTTSMEERAYPPLPEPLEGCALSGDVERVGVAAEAAPAAAAATATAAAIPPQRQPAARRRGLHPGRWRERERRERERRRPKP